MVEPDTESIYREIENLYLHPEVLAELTRNCRPYAEEHFSEKNISVITDSYNP